MMRFLIETLERFINTSESIFIYCNIRYLFSAWRKPMMILKKIYGSSGKIIEVFAHFQSLLARQCMFCFHGK